MISKKKKTAHTAVLRQYAALYKQQINPIYWISNFVIRYLPDKNVCSTLAFADSWWRVNVFTRAHKEHMGSATRQGKTSSGQVGRW